MKQQGNRDPFGITAYLESKYPGISDDCIEYSMKRENDGRITLTIKVIIDELNVANRNVPKLDRVDHVEYEVDSEGYVQRAPAAPKEV